MKFFYWLSRILGSTTLLIISIIGLGVVALIAAGGYYLRDEAFVQGIINSLNEIIANLNDTPQGVPIPDDVKQLITQLENVRTFFSSNKDLMINVGNGAFIGAIIFGSIFILSILGWLCFEPAYKRSKKPKVNRAVTNSQQEYL